VAETNHAFWPADVSVLDRKVFNPDRILGPQQLTDAYLLALAVKHGGCFATIDSGVALGSVRGAEDRHLVMI
jgi:predicted nucleic acid-binding protein